MKKKEKEHLKADPFVHFMQQAYAFLKSHRRPLLLAFAAVALAALALLALFLFRSLSAGSENRLYAEALRAYQDEKAGLEERVARLKAIGPRRGLAAAAQLFLASLHYQQGDLDRAEAVLAAMPASRVAVLNDQKLVLHARILSTRGRSDEAEALLQRRLQERAGATPTEDLLLLLAQVQAQGKKSEQAASTLKRIVSDHAQTQAAMEAQRLLADLEKDAAPAG